MWPQHWQKSLYSHEHKCNYKQHSQHTTLIPYRLSKLTGSYLQVLDKIYCDKWITNNWSISSNHTQSSNAPHAAAAAANTSTDVLSMKQTEKWESK